MENDSNCLCYADFKNAFMNTEVPSCGGRMVCISIGGAEVHLKRPLEFFKGAADGSIRELVHLHIGWARDLFISLCRVLKSKQTNALKNEVFFFSFEVEIVSNIAKQIFTAGFAVAFQTAQQIGKNWCKVIIITKLS